MEGINLIKKYFPNLSEDQIRKFELMGIMYPEWNSKINVISRKDIDNLFENHILHSLAIAKFLGPLAPGTTFMDLGTGGGFPGVPLAAMYPECQFTLIDRTAKKLRVAEDISSACGMTNIKYIHGDAGECHEKFDYVVSRAVTQLNPLLKLCIKNIAQKSPTANRYSNGIICLKGGDLSEESSRINFPVIEYPLNEFFSETFYNEKKLLYIPVKK